MSKQAVFRTDANAKIGTGHLLRCQILALKLQKLNFQITFLSKKLNPQLEERLEGDNIAVVNYADYIKEEELLDDYFLKLGNNGATILIIDHDNPELYKLDLQQKIKSIYGIKVMYFDFTGENEFQADIVLNQNIRAFDLEYNVAEHTHLLRGPEYVILNDDFDEINKQDLKQFEEKEEVALLFFGGADIRNQTLHFLQILGESPRLFEKLIVVCGALNPDLEQIKHFIEENAHLQAELHINTPQMPFLMAGAKYAITSGGLTIWELATLNSLQIISPSREREEKTVRYCEENNLVHHLKMVANQSRKEILNKIQAFKNDPSNHEKVNKFHSLVATDGAAKVSSIINDVLN
ncbi:UDP-2,4-diacetamido-2,4,6-trideoxy-beta-L-altropyranose hydrolase [Marivirga sp.]|uniref:UDP-2,4-diacetamido-2,4, 6-trideoxy-beta-L-altropyranose hydrolase n=1 Tax=Marivirga sp. TaxID=2018662 RepID=UPI0025D95D1F|nr:UDP-2,4-diacetamido-2,4,6-trideoxy-beta-L-altropyranose hydrolase [Marivirga sp.]